MVEYSQAQLTLVLQIAVQHFMVSFYGLKKYRVSIYIPIYYLNSRSSMSGNERYSSSTKSTNDDLVVFKTRSSFKPLITAGRTSEQNERRKNAINNFAIEENSVFFLFGTFTTSTLTPIIRHISYFISISR